VALRQSPSTGSITKARARLGVCAVENVVRPGRQARRDHRHSGDVRTSSGRLRQAADVVIAQTVIDPHDQLASRGHDTDVTAAALFDPVACLPETGMRAEVLHCFDRGPADQPRALFGDPPAVHGGVGLAVSRGQPSPASQLRWERAGPAVPSAGYECVCRGSVQQVRFDRRWVAIRYLWLRPERVLLALPAR